MRRSALSLLLVLTALLLPLAVQANPKLIKAALGEQAEETPDQAGTAHQEGEGSADQGQQVAAPQSAEAAVTQGGDDASQAAQETAQEEEPSEPLNVIEQGGADLFSFVDATFDYVKGRPWPLIVTILLILLASVLSQIARIHKTTIHIKAPRLATYGALFLFLLSAVFNQYSASFANIFYFVSLTGITLAATQLSGVIVIDIFLQRRGIRVPTIIRDLLVIIVFVVAIFVVLGNQGVNLTAILASAGFVGIVLGLAMQDTLGNIISGLALQMERPFSVGEFVRFEDREGRVTEINWRSVRIETKDLETIIVPNSMITKASVVNLCRPTNLLRRHTIIGLPYGLPPNRAKRVIEDALKKLSSIVVDPPPKVLLTKYSDYSIDYKVTYFLAHPDGREDVLDEVNTVIWYALRRAGIEVPFPIQDIFVHNPEGKEKELSLREEEFQERLELLTDVPFFEPLPRDDLDHLARKARTEAFAAGEEVVRKGDLGASFFIVRDGTAVVVGRDDTDGSAIEIARLHRGAHFGEMSLMTGERRTATVVAHEDCEFLVVDREPFREVINRNPESLERISEIIVARKQATQKELDTR